MKLTVQCHECFDQAFKTPFASVPEDSQQQLKNMKSFIGYEVELSEEFTYDFECENGHQQIAILKTPRFELLMQIAVSAILDFYYREAVASASAALERFYEYYLNVQSISKQIDGQIFKKSWKNLSRSERQIGAYVATYLFNEKESPLTLDNTDIISGRAPSKFRNDVIHNGFMPTRSEAIQFGNRVISLIFPALNKLRQMNLSSIELFEDREYTERLNEAKKRADNQTLIWYRHHTVFGPSHKIANSLPNMESLLVQLDTFRKGTRSSDNK